MALECRPLGVATLAVSFWARSLEPPFLSVYRRQDWSATLVFGACKEIGSVLGFARPVRAAHVVETMPSSAPLMKASGVIT